MNKTKLRLELTTFSAVSAKITKMHLNWGSPLHTFVSEWEGGERGEEIMEEEGAKFCSWRELFQSKMDD